MGRVPIRKRWIVRKRKFTIDVTTEVPDDGERLGGRESFTLVARGIGEPKFSSGSDGRISSSSSSSSS